MYDLNIEKKVKVLSDIFQQINNVDSESFYEYKQKNNDTIKSSQELGRQGWVAPLFLDYCFADHNCDAVEFAKSNVKQFEEECIKRNVVETIITKTDEMKYLNDNEYYKKAKENMNRGDYFVVALCLIPLIESIVDKILDVGNESIRKKEKYSNKSFENNSNKQFNKGVNSRIEKDIFIKDVFPSLVAYMSNIYCLGHKEWNEGSIEHLKRDLLLHGRNNYIITELDCIKLFNALSVATFTFLELIKY